MSTAAPDTQTPTQRGRELVRGGFDVHVHIDPDVIGRTVDDVTLAERFREQPVEAL